MPSIALGVRIGGKGGGSGVKKGVITARPGYYNITGTNAVFHHSKRVIPTVGSYALTGTNPALKHGWKIVAGAASYALTGVDAALSHSFPNKIIAGAGAYALSGTPSTMPRTRKIIPVAGAYALTGTNPALKHGAKVVAGAGSYALTGTAAALNLANFAAPLLAYTGSDPTTDQTPDFTATFYQSILGQTIRLVGSQVAGAGTPYTVDVGNTIDGTEDDLLLAAFTTGNLADGLTYFKCRIEDGGGSPLSLWSNVVSFTINTGAVNYSTPFSALRVVLGAPFMPGLLLNPLIMSLSVAPILTNPTDTATGQTTATLTVTTDTTNGTLYSICTNTAGQPSAAQVKAGKNILGNNAAFANSVAVTSTGVKTILPDNLTASIFYTAYFAHENSNGQISLVSAGDGFTTSA